MNDLTRFVGGACLVLFSTAAIAADKAAPAPAPAPAKAPAAAKAPAPANAPAKAGDPSGNWTWSFTAPSGETFQRAVKLTREGEKVTGSSTGRDGQQHPIEEGTFKNGEVAFKLVREREGRKMVSSFKGTVEGDVIKGTMTSNRGGEERSTPWEAKRQK